MYISIMHEIGRDETFRKKMNLLIDSNVASYFIVCTKGDTNDNESKRSS